MTPQQLQAMKLALEALISITNAIYVNSEQEANAVYKANDAITAIKEALSEHAMQEVQRLGQEIEQEPVAWMDADGNVSDNNDHKCFPIPLYTHPPQRTWVDVPDEEIKRLWIQYRAALPRYLCFAKDLLSIAKEKNT